MLHMKSKIIKLYMLGVMTLLASAAFVSCEESNDWKTDSSYDRLFMPSAVSISASATDAELSWKSTPGTQFYIIELSTDSLFGLKSDYSANSQILGEDGSIKSSPYQLTDLNNSTKYFIRIKGCADNVASSNWAYLSSIFFETKSENILKPITDEEKGEDYIILTWEPGLAVTHVTSEESIGTTEDGAPLYAEPVVIQLTAEDKANGTVTISGLKESTGYLLSIYNNTSLRGSRLTTTAIALPEVDLTVTLGPGETLTQEMIDSWVDQKNVMVIFSAGETYDIAGKEAADGTFSTLDIPTDMSITFYGEEGGDKPILNMIKDIVFKGTHPFFQANNIQFNDSKSGYLINQESAMYVSDLLFSGCEFNGFTNSIIRFKGTAAKTVDNIKFDRCSFNNICTGSYALVHLNSENYTANNIELNDCTLNGVGNDVLRLTKASVTTVSFNYCTLYNAIGSGRYLVDAGASNSGPAITITNTLFGKSSGAKGYRGYAPTVNNSYVLTDGVFAGNSIKGLISYGAASDAVFEDPAIGDFTIKDSNFPTGVGATRWYPQ